MTEPAKRFDQTRRWPQFSLRSALIVIVIVGIAASLWVSRRQPGENVQLRQENARLRNEAGELTIEPGTEDQIHAIGVPTVEQLAWKWRVYVPPGRNYRIHVASGKVAPTGDVLESHNPSSFSVENGESLVTVALRRDVHDHWIWKVQSGPVGTGASADDELANILVGDSYTSTTTGVGLSNPAMVAANRPLELLRLRAFRNQNTVPNANASPTDGVLVWISENSGSP